MEWLYRLFFKEGFEPRWFTAPFFLGCQLVAWAGIVYVAIHFIRKYW